MIEYKINFRTNCKPKLKKPAYAEKERQFYLFNKIVCANADSYWHLFSERFCWKEQSPWPLKPKEITGYAIFVFHTAAPRFIS